MGYRNNQEIGKRLMDELSRMQSEHAAANEAFTTVMRQTPSGLPHPDGTLRVQKAGREYRRTLELYSRALKRYSDFILHGVVPPPD